MHATSSSLDLVWNALAAAVDQLQPDMGFEPLDAPRQAGLRDMQLLGRLVEASELRDLDEGLDAVDRMFHDKRSLIYVIISAYEHSRLGQ